MRLPLWDLILRSARKVDFQLLLGGAASDCLYVIAVMVEIGYYHLQGRWVELWMSSGLVLRYCVPLSLNIGYGYHTDGIPASLVDYPVRIPNLTEL